MLPIEKALTRLKEGNARFAAGTSHRDAEEEALKLRDLSTGQKPFGIILGCSDSRVPVEIIFDQGLGDLFVIRVAGNIIAPSVIGSVEFAAECFGAKLVVVLGHSHCGAIAATLDALTKPMGSDTPHIPSIVDCVRPAVEPLLNTNLREDREALLKVAVRTNVMISANHLRHSSLILEKRIADGRLAIVGAEYDIESGQVAFIDDSLSS